MKFSVVTYHLPHPDGTAAGRHVFALWDAVRAMGHEVEAWCWGDPPAGLEPPSWVSWERYHDPGGWRRLPTTIRRPRGGLAEVGWQPPEDAIAWAEEPESYAAVARAEVRGVGVYHSTVLDAIALRQPRAAVVQSARAERHAVRDATVALAYSERVASAIGTANVFPMTLPIPDARLRLVSEPTVLMLANWSWPPNQVALERLLRAWPEVVRAVPDALLLIAGRGFSRTLTTPGVEIVGEVAQARDALARAAVFAFPCPSTSGPKMKVLEAMAYGVPVVTTPAGAEGIDGGAGAVAVAGKGEFAATLIDVLGDPERRAELARASRTLIVERHAPKRAAIDRIALLASPP